MFKYEPNAHNGTKCEGTFMKVEKKTAYIRNNWITMSSTFALVFSYKKKSVCKTTTLKYLTIPELI